MEDTSRIAEFDSLSACRDNSPRMGYEGVRTALVGSKGDQVLTNIDIGATFITKANINSARSQELLNPKVK